MLLIEMLNPGEYANRFSAAVCSGYGLSKSLPVRMIMTHAKTSASRIALSFCCVMQYVAVPFVKSAVVFSKAAASSGPDQYTSDVAVSQAMTDGGAAEGAKSELLM